MSNTTPQRTLRSVDELRACVGQELGVGAWLELTQDRVDAYAEETADRRVIYVDPVAAKATRFGGTIAPPFLLLGMLHVLQRNRAGIRVEIPARSNVNYGLNGVRFLSPVRVGTRMRARTRLLAVDTVREDVLQVTYGITLEVEHVGAGTDTVEPALVADLLSRIYL